MRAINRTRDTVLVDQGVIASNAWTRMRGLLGHAPLKSGEGLMLRGEKAIHSMWMGFSIDVLFLDKEDRVIHLMHAMPPWRFSEFVWRAKNVLELPSGKIQETGTALGDQLEIQSD